MALSSPRKLSGGATTTVSASSPDEVSSKDVWLLAAGSSRKSHSPGTYKIIIETVLNHARKNFFPMLYCILKFYTHCVMIYSQVASSLVQKVTSVGKLNNIV